MTSVPPELFDALLAVGIVVAAWRALAGPRPAVSVVLFVVFGLLLALAWARLEAPDIALAEAAIGAGLTGALLFAALGHLRPPPEEGPAGRRRGIAGAATAVLAGGFALVLALAVADLPADRTGLARTAADALERTGVTHPTTAVLLDFRAYDTLLEVAVLLAAAAGVLALDRSAAVLPSPQATAERVPVALASIVLPAALLVGGYLLWLGTHAPGGAFQAGAVVAAAAVLLRVAGPDPLARLPGAALTVLLALGLAVFLAVGVAVGVDDRAFLDYPPAAAGALIVLVEAAVTVSVAVTLAALFALAAPTPAPEGRG